MWHNEGLPSDRMSTENATILCNSDRWPLMIDPQVINSLFTFNFIKKCSILKLQGVKWIKQKHGDSLQVIRLGQKGFLEIIEKSIMSGATVLVENIEESVDPVLDALLGRNLIKKGK